MDKRFTADHIETLAHKFKTGTLTPAEQADLDAWYQSHNDTEFPHSDSRDPQQIKDRLLANILAETNLLPKSKFKTLWPRIVAAASILLALSFGTYYFMNRDKTAPNSATAELIAPVQKGVYLTLANGQKVALNQNHFGRTKIADGTQVNQNSNELSYQQANAATESQIHTLTNNSNSKYSLVLADGSEAYLDVASSITYPVAFTGKQRDVTVTGQAYFKVKHNAAQPFNVHAGDQLIEDIGTEFNIDGYHDIKTTLIQGAVRVRLGQSKTLILKPGEEAYLANNELVSSAADLEMATIWLQGKIPLNHRSLENVLSEVGRIYDVQFVWPDPSLKRLKFGGAVSRTQKLSNILDFLRNTGKVDFTVEGRIVTVFKKKQ